MCVLSWWSVTRTFAGYMFHCQLGKHLDNVPHTRVRPGTYELWLNVPGTVHRNITAFMGAICYEFDDDVSPGAHTRAVPISMIAPRVDEGFVVTVRQAVGPCVMNMCVWGRARAWATLNC